MTGTIRRILVIGGYGTFGGRLVELLAASDRLHVIVAGRSYEKARQFCASLTTEGVLEPAAVDRDGDLDAMLDRWQPGLVVDASGPFQAYGHQPYRLVAAAIERGVHYADLADCADFVRGVARFDAAAKSAGVFVLSGLSTCPALTAAAVRELSSNLSSIDAIYAGIAPSPAVDVGESVVRAIASYAGKPVAVSENNRTPSLHALTDHRDVTVGVPGRLPLSRRRFSLVEVPDLCLLRDTFPDVREVWVGAAIAPPVLHRVLNAMAGLVRWRLLPSLVPFVPLMRRVSKLLSWGEPRGGMFVTVAGHCAGSREVQRSWHLVANGARGPYIPTIATAAVVERCKAGNPPKAGARPATQELTMQDFNGFFTRLGVNHGVREAAPESCGRLYQRVLGCAWSDLPVSLRRLHGDVSVSSGRAGTSPTKWRGRARVVRGMNPLARLVCVLFRFPSASEDIDVTIEFRREHGRETWVRDFSGQRFASVQYEGRGAYDGLICERFGPFRFGLAAVVDNGVLRLPIRRWDILGLTLPLSLAPKSDACEFDRDGVFHFRVDVSLPLAGPVVRYEGYFDEVLQDTVAAQAARLVSTGRAG